MNSTHKRQNSAHNFSVKCKSVCVATLAALAGEMAGICDTWLSLVRT